MLCVCARRKAWRKARLLCGARRSASGASQPRRDTWYSECTSDKHKLQFGTTLIVSQERAKTYLTLCNMPPSKSGGPATSSRSSARPASGSPSSGKTSRPTSGSPKKKSSPPKKKPANDAVSIFANAYGACTEGNFAPAVEILSTVNDADIELHDFAFERKALPGMLLLSPEGNDGNTMLHWAAHHGDELGAKELLRLGAAPQQRNARGHNSLDVALAFDRSEGA